MDPILMKAVISHLTARIAGVRDTIDDDLPQALAILRLGAEELTALIRAVEGEMAAGDGPEITVIRTHG